MLNPMPKTFDYRPPLEPWLTVLHADDDIVVLDKPSGLLTVPGKDPALADSLEARVRAKWPTATVVHRLDKDTSGILLMALHKKALGFLGSQFEHRRTTKSYVARVWGVIDDGVADVTFASQALANAGVLTQVVPEAELGMGLTWTASFGAGSSLRLASITTSTAGCVLSAQATYTN